MKEDLEHQGHEEKEVPQEMLEDPEAQDSQVLLVMSAPLETLAMLECRD